MRHEANALRARYVRKKRMLLTTLNTEDSRIHVEIGITVEKEEQTTEKIRNKAGGGEREMGICCQEKNIGRIKNKIEIPKMLQKITNLPTAPQRQSQRCESFL